MRSFQLSSILIALAIPHLSAVSGNDAATVALSACVNGTAACFRMPDGCGGAAQCQVAATYKLVNNSGAQQWIQFELITKWTGQEGNKFRYVAIGFSHDTKMGDDAATACVSNVAAGGHNVYLQYNPRHGVSDRLPLEVTNASLDLIRAADQDGWYYCRLRQLVEPQPHHADVYALNRPYHLLLAVGPAERHRLAFHQSYFYASRAAIDVSAGHGSSGGSASALDDLLVRVHACSMLVAFWLFSATAILTAAFFKREGDKKVMGAALWFQIHRALNLTCVALTMLSAAAIVYAAGFDLRLHTAHKALGMAALLLAWTQPVVALFRCHPGDARRWIFKWWHTLQGYTAWCLAAAAIIIARYTIPLLSESTDTVELGTSTVMFAYLGGISNMLTACSIGQRNDFAMSRTRKVTFAVMALVALAAVVSICVFIGYA